MADLHRPAARPRASLHRGWRLLLRVRAVDIGAAGGYRQSGSGSLFVVALRLVHPQGQCQVEGQRRERSRRRCAASRTSAAPCPEYVLQSRRPRAGSPTRRSKSARRPWSKTTNADAAHRPPASPPFPRSNSTTSTSRSCSRLRPAGGRGPLRQGRQPRGQAAGREQDQPSPGRTPGSRSTLLTPPCASGSTTSSTKRPEHGKVEELVAQLETMDATDVVDVVSPSSRPSAAPRRRRGDRGFSKFRVAGHAAPQALATVSKEAKWTPARAGTVTNWDGDVVVTSLGTPTSSKPPPCTLTPGLVDLHHATGFAVPPARRGSTLRVHTAHHDGDCDASWRRRARRRRLRHWKWRSTTWDHAAPPTLPA